MNNKRHSKKWSVLMISPFLVSFILFWLIPVGFGIWISLHEWTISGGNGGFVLFDNYIKLLTSGNVFHDTFVQGLRNTLIFVLISVIPLILIGLFLALLIDALPEKLKAFFRTIFLLSYSISVTTVSAVFLWLFNSSGGYVNTLLGSVGILNEPIMWLNSQPYAWITILIATVWWTVGFNMMLFINALNEVDPSLYEAASLDGVNMFTKFFYITFPQIRNVAMFIGITTVIASFNLYGQSLLITGGGPSQSTNTLIMNIQRTVFDMNNLGVGSAMAILMGLIMMMITATQYWLSYRNTD